MTTLTPTEEVKELSTKLERAREEIRLRDIELNKSQNALAAAQQAEADAAAELAQVKADLKAAKDETSKYAASEEAANAKAYDLVADEMASLRAKLAAVTQELDGANERLVGQQPALDALAALKAALP